MSRPWHWRCLFSAYKHTLYREMDKDLIAQYEDGRPSRPKRRNSYNRTVARKHYSHGYNATSSYDPEKPIGKNKKVYRPSHMAKLLRKR